MSSVIRLHLLSQSMLNVSCQKQKHCSLLLTLTDSSMEFAGQPRLSEACNLLAVPGLSCLDVDEDEGEVVIGIRPKSSPLPRRKSSVSEEDSEPEAPPCGSRRVSFADAKGLSLVQVKEFDTWDVPKLPGNDTPDGEGRDAEEYYLSTFTFLRPLSSEELFAKVLQQKAELETVEILPGTTIVKGVIRVLNISYSKAVYIRTTLDEWSTHFDLLAEYIPGSSDGVMDCFSFKLTLVPPFGEQGARVDFCLRYETPVGTFWSNNNNRNYVLFCHHRMKAEKEKPLKENVNKKSCLKIVNQNISPEENNSSKQESLQENISTDESNNKAEVHQIKAEGPLRMSEEKKQELLMENKQNSSRRRRRKAARLAKVRDYFSQRNGGADRDEACPEIKQATQEGTPGEKRADMHAYSTGNSKSECAQFVFEALETSSSELPHNVAHDRTTCKDVEKSDPAALARAESATDIPDSLLQSADESALAKQQNITELVGKSEESSQTQNVSCACAGNSGAASCESVFSQAGSLTFGTVVAPLYHQVFSRVGSERQSAGGEENPVDTGDFNPLFEQGQTGNIVPAEIKNNSSKDQGSMITNLDSNHPEITQNSTCVAQNPTETEQEIEQNCTNKSKGPNPPLGDTPENPDAVNLLSDTDLLASQIQGETQQNNQTQDLHRQTAEPQQCQPPEQICAQLVANVDETQSETLAVLKPVESVSEQLIEETDQQTSSTVENNSAEMSRDTDLTETTSNPSSSFRENKLLETLEDFNSNHVDNTVTGRSVCSLDSSEPERKNLLTLETSLQSQKDTYSKEKGNKGMFVSHKNETENKSIHEVVELMTNDMMSNDHSQPDMFLQLKVQDNLEMIEHHDMEAAVSKQHEDFCLMGNDVLKNWEMMVEEEENAILANKEESDLINGNAKDTDAPEKDVAERKTEEFEEELTVTAAQEKMDNTVESEEWIREEGNVETEAIKDAESDSVEVIETEKIFGAEITAEVETKGKPEKTEPQKEKHFADIQQVSIERTRVQDEEGVEVEGEMEINYEGEAGVEQEYRELKEENREEQISDHKEENTVTETEEAEIAEADLCIEIENRGDEVECFEERSDITQSKVADGLSALVSNGLEVEKEYTEEEQHENIETGFPSNEDVTHDRSKTDKHPALEGDVYVSTDEPEGDHDSASAESDSDDEVELYMHCLRAVGASAQAHKDRIKDAGFTVGKRPSISRGKLPSTRMPSISESLDEEQHASSTEESHDDVKTAASTALPVSSGQESSSRNVWWKETFSCSNISKTLLCTTLLAIFLVVAYHYDFLACFGLYLISIVWLCCQGDKQPVKSKNRAD